MYIISEHIVAVVTVKNAFKLVTQLVSQRRSLSWVSCGKCENVRHGTKPITIMIDAGIATMPTLIA
jgi:hypothetical protein